MFYLALKTGQVLIGIRVHTGPEPKLPIATIPNSGPCYRTCIYTQIQIKGLNLDVDQK